MIKKRAILCLTVILTVVLAAGVEMFWLSRQKTVKEYKESQAAFGNPLMDMREMHGMIKFRKTFLFLYMDITWAELEPRRVFMTGMGHREKNQLARWKSEGEASGIEIRL